MAQRDRFAIVARHAESARSRRRSAARQPPQTTAVKVRRLLPSPW